MTTDVGVITLEVENSPAVISIVTPGPAGPQGETGPTGPEGSLGSADYVDHGTITTGTATIDRSDNSIVHKITAGGDFTIDITNWETSGTYGEVVLYLTNGGAHTVTFPTVTWYTVDGNQPNLQTIGTDIIVFTSVDGGSTIDGFAARPQFPTEVIMVAATNEDDGISTGTKTTFRMTFGFTLTSVRASLTTAQSSGNIFTVDINEDGSSILSTKLTIDNGEKTSTTAATQAVLSDTFLADDAEITIDVDQIGDGTAAGLKVYLIGHQ